MMDIISGAFHPDHMFDEVDVYLFIYLCQAQKRS